MEAKSGRTALAAPHAATGLGTVMDPVQLVADLHLVRFSLDAEPSRERRLIAVDGSAPDSPGDVSACAAVTSDGRVLTAWYKHPALALGRASTFAEWQAFRLGLRLAASAQAPVTIEVDNETVFTEARSIQRGLAHLPSNVGASDPMALGEIRTLMRHGPPVTIVWRHLSGRSQVRHKTGGTQLSRCAHAAAWLIRRTVADGIDPETDREWLGQAILQGPSRHAALSAYYRAHRDAQPR